MSTACLALTLPRLAMLLLSAAQVAVPQSLPQPSVKETYDFRAQFQWYTKRTYTDPSRHVMLLAGVTFDDFVFGEVKKWGTGLSGWGKSLAPTYGQRVVANTTEFLLDSVIGADARYRPSGKTALTARIWSAATQAFTARARDGTVSPAYSRIVAVTTGLLVSNQWRARPRCGGDLRQATFLALTDRIQANLLQEFEPDLKKFGRKLWSKVRP